MRLPAACFFILICAFHAVADLPPDTPFPSNDKWWYNYHNYLTGLVTQASSKPRLDIYFLGDSITEFWPHLAKDVWDKEYGTLRVLNNGVRGDTTQNILYRITHGEFERIHPKVVVLLAGINNLGTDPKLAPQSLAKGIQAIIAVLHAKSPESKILLISILPSGELPADPVRKRIQDTNALLAKLADDKTIFFLDIYNHFLDADGKFSPELTPDELHLNARGYQVWADAMRATLQKLLGLFPEGN
jgi:lysophospholipase L1-like esterase